MLLFVICYRVSRCYLLYVTMFHAAICYMLPCFTLLFVICYRVSRCYLLYVTMFQAAICYMLPCFTLLFVICFRCELFIRGVPIADSLFYGKKKTRNLAAETFLTELYGKNLCVKVSTLI